MFFAEQQQLRVARETAAAMAAPLAMASVNASPTDAKATDAKPVDTKPAEAKPKPQEPPVEQRLFRAEAMARFNAQMKRGLASSSGWSPSGRIISRCRSPRPGSSGDRRRL